MLLRFARRLDRLRLLMTGPKGCAAAPSCDLNLYTSGAFRPVLPRPCRRSNSAKVF
jgi:hypothetical protein